MEPTTVILLFIGLGLWWWFDTFRTQERAKVIGKTLCSQYGCQLLDETVALVRVRPKRNGHGRWGVQRVYYFEFSDNGNNRKSGVMVMWGIQLEMLELPDYEKRVILPV